MNMVAWICTRPDPDWDPLCRTEHTLLLAVVGLLAGAVVAWLRIARPGNRHGHGRNLVEGSVLIGVTFLAVVWLGFGL